MWRFKPFTQKESAGLEGRTFDVGNVKVHVRNAIAEGGFSCVYIARDVVSSKQYALKHMICNDSESLDLVMKEISVMKLLKGHPNVITLVAHTIVDMGRTKEAFLVMEFCEKSLVGMLDNRGAGYFDEKQILLIFRDVCNAVFAMHNQSPPIAHRDLKAENILVGSNGAWKLCDFGSTSTNHKCFDRPEEMGIEEDNIRKHTTPAYRAPEMWDLFRREVISEKVDIWALGCILYRICYLKLAFDGESKLQILNGNYRIPELPKYSPSITGLVKDMLQGSPDSRPDITQVWFRVNEQLPVELQKHLPDGTMSVVNSRQSMTEQDLGSLTRTPSMPRRSPPQPPSSRDQSRNIASQSEKDTHFLKSDQATSKNAPIGSFWSTKLAQDAVLDDSGALFDAESTIQMKTKPHRDRLDRRGSTREEQNAHPGQLPRNLHGNSLSEPTTIDFETSFLPDDTRGSLHKTRTSYSESKPYNQNEAFNSFIADFDTSKFPSGSTVNIPTNKLGKEELETEVERLNEELRHVNFEKAKITSKYEKLSAICRSQRQEIQELKRELSARTPSPVKGSSKSEFSPGDIQSHTSSQDKTEGILLEVQHGMLGNISSPSEPQLKPWEAFTGDPKSHPTNNLPKSVRTTSAHKHTGKQSDAQISNNIPGDFQNKFSALHTTKGTTSQRYATGEMKKPETSQPAGWAGF